MNKKITFFLFLLFSISAFSQDIRNVKFNKSPSSVQENGKPYKFDITFDFIWDKPPQQAGIRLWYGLVTRKDATPNYFGSPRPITSSHSVALNAFVKIPNGYRYTFTSIKLVDKFSSYPIGDFKVMIVGWQGNGRFALFGGYNNHISKYTFNFSLNDFCSDCGDGYYVGDNNKSDLRFEPETSAVYSACFNCPPPLDAFFKSGKRHLIRGSVGQLVFDRLQIRNKGKAIAFGRTAKFYLSKDNKLDKADFKIFKEYEVPQIPPSKSHGMLFTVVGQDILDPKTQNRYAGDYFILVVIDADNTAPTGEKVVSIAIPITYSQSAAKGNGAKFFVQAQNTFEEPYLIDIYDFTGKKVMSGKATDIEDENAIIRTLPKKIYVVKSKNGDRKISY